MQNDYKGYSLFNDIEDEQLRTRNRAIILANIAEGNMDKKSKINIKGGLLLLNYFNLIPEVERSQVTEKFKEVMKERHYAMV